MGELVGYVNTIKAMEWQPLIEWTNNGAATSVLMQRIKDVQLDRRCIIHVCVFNLLSISTPKNGHQLGPSSADKTWPLTLAITRAH